MKKLRLKTKINICIGFVWAGAVLALLSRMLGSWCLWAGLAILVVATLFRYGLLRCPHCGHPLSDGKQVPSVCPKCGEEL